MAKWTEEQKLKALAIAEASSVREAARQTGISKTTISRWLNESKDGTSHETGQTGRDSVPKKAQKIAEEAVEEAKEEVREYIADRVKQAADQILEMVEMSVKIAKQTLYEGPNEDEPKAGWLRAVIGAMGQGVEKHQLLMGKPTTRQEVQGEVTTRNEQHQHYHIIQELVNQDDEVADRLLTAFRRQGDL